MDRRTFLRRAAVTAAATVLAPSVVARAAEASEEAPEHPLDTYYRQQDDIAAVDIIENWTENIAVPAHWKDNPIKAQEPAIQWTRPEAQWTATIDRYWTADSLTPKIVASYFNGTTWERL